MTEVLVKIRVSYIGDAPANRWGYELEFCLPSVIMDTRHYYTVAPGLRIKRPFMDSFLDVILPIGDPARGFLNVGEPGPVITFRETRFGFEDRESAEAAALNRYSDLEKDLGDAARAIQEQPGIMTFYHSY